MYGSITRQTSCSGVRAECIAPEGGIPAAKGYLPSTSTTRRNELEKASTTLLAVAMAAAICVWGSEAQPDDLVVSPAVRRTGSGQSQSIRQVADRATKSKDPSITESISSGIKGGWKKVTGVLTPKDITQKADDPTSVFSTAQPSAEFYVAMARLHEQTGRTTEAEAQYKKALREDRDDLKAMLGYAHLLDRSGRTREAVQFYERAAKAHPHNAAPLNDLGLCQARRGKLDEAIAALERAVRLQPERPLYRNNLATMLVDHGQAEAAFTHFKAAHGEAAAHYNLGFLLQKKGDRRAAAARFAAALRVDPSFDEARAWLQRLQPVDRKSAAPSISGHQPERRPTATVAPRMQRPTPAYRDRPTVSPAPNGPITQPPLRFQPGEPGSPKLRKLPPLPKLRPTHKSPSDLPTGAFTAPPAASQPPTPSDFRTGAFTAPPAASRPPAPAAPMPGSMPEQSTGPVPSLPSSMIRQSNDGPPVPRIQPLPPVAPMPGPPR